MTPAPARTTPAGRLTRIAALVAALVFVTFLVLTTSRAAFTGSTSNDGNSVAAGSVALSDDDSDTAMFQITGAVPGPLGARCIEVSYDGAAPAGEALKLYRASALAGSLGSYLDLTVQVGAGGSSADCTGFTPSSTLFTGTVASFDSSKTAYGTGLDTGWTPASGESRTFKFELALQDEAAAQGQSAAFGYTWEARS